MTTEAVDTVRKLRAALKKYGNHKRSCDLEEWNWFSRTRGWTNRYRFEGHEPYTAFRTEKPQCTCGFEKARQL